MRTQASVHKPYRTDDDNYGSRGGCCYRPNPCGPLGLFAEGHVLIETRVVASLWAASDVYTLNLIQHFYRYIADGEDKGSALRHAQTHLIREFGDQAMPFYWAGFAMVGDGSRNIRLSVKGRR